VKITLLIDEHWWQNCRQKGGLHVDDREQRFILFLFYFSSRDADDADTYNRSFCELCSTDIIKMFLSVNQIMLTSPDDTFSTTILNG